MLKILEQLCTLDGTSGYEDGVRAAIAGMIMLASISEIERRAEAKIRNGRL